MAIWDNRSKEEKEQIKMSVKALSNFLRRNRRKNKIENVLCIRS